MSLLLYNQKQEIGTQVFDLQYWYSSLQTKNDSH